MRNAVAVLVLVDWVLVYAPAALAEERERVVVTCPAISFDDRDDRGSDIPHGPSPVVLIVKAKARPVPSKSSERGQFELKVALEEYRLQPALGDGPFEYFIGNDGRVQARWSATTVRSIEESLQRREEYPVVEVESGETKATYEAPALSIAWAGKSAWTIESVRPPPRSGDPFEEDTPNGKSPKKSALDSSDDAPNSLKLPGPDDDDDPFGSPSPNLGKPYPVVRKRVVDKSEEVDCELKLPFQAARVLSSRHGRVVVVCGVRQVVVIASDENRVVAHWRASTELPVTKAIGDMLALSPDGEVLAIGECDLLPQTVETRTGHARRQLAKGLRHGTWVSNLEFRDCDLLWTRDKGGQVIEWNLAGVNATPVPGKLLNGVHEDEETDPTVRLRSWTDGGARILACGGGWPHLARRRKRGRKVRPLPRL